ncbi:MAG: hypothetical protein QOJ91_1876 [Sphingomonadales bacterium]|jgi:hypothetical protein|nr:hypothetical protein [Sphingomonadales bacterium]
MIIDWKTELISERSLQEAFAVSTGLPKSKFNRKVYITALSAIGVIAAWWIYLRDVEQSAAAAVAAADIAFDLSVQILGFLIGGFAIFATVTDQRLMVRLAQTPMAGSTLSVFKYVFFNFLSVFYIYVITLACGVGVKLLDQVNLVHIDVLLPAELASLLLAITNAGVFALLSFLIVLAVVRLKSFIWNIYQGFLTFLIVSDVMNKERDAHSSAHCDMAPDNIDGASADG